LSNKDYDETSISLSYSGVIICVFVGVVLLVGLMLISKIDTIFNMENV